MYPRVRVPHDDVIEHRKNLPFTFIDNRERQRTYIGYYTLAQLQLARLLITTMIIIIILIIILIIGARGGVVG
jgi:hypothetical protein